MPSAVQYHRNHLIGAKLHNTKTLIIGVLLGTFAQWFIAFCILIMLSYHPEATVAEMPMLAVAAKYGMLFYWVYGFLLFTGMFGTSVSCFVSAHFFLAERFPILAKYRKILLFCSMIPIYICSRISFAKLVGLIYPFYGYIAIGFTILILGHFIYLKYQRSRPYIDKNREN